MQERRGDATFFDQPLTVVGPRLQSGDAGPKFILTAFNPETYEMSPFGLHDVEGKPVILNVVVSLDTPVCHTQTKRWQQEVDGLPGVEVLTISKDLPFAQQRWKDAEGVSHATLSAYRDDGFAIDYGVLMKELQLLQRSVFIIDAGGLLAYVEYVNEQTQEPDYESALAVARSLAV